MLFKENNIDKISFIIFTVNDFKICVECPQ